jgi:hypothetical protein
MVLRVSCFSPARGLSSDALGGSHMLGVINGVSKIVIIAIAIKSCDGERLTVLGLVELATDAVVVSLYVSYLEGPLSSSFSTGQ